MKEQKLFEIEWGYESVNCEAAICMKKGKQIISRLWAVCIVEKKGRNSLNMQTMIIIINESLKNSSS